ARHASPLVPVVGSQRPLWHSSGFAHVVPGILPGWVVPQLAPLHAPPLVVVPSTAVPSAV
ncbi:MAG TPA: hypothetical protein VHW01_07340, partial [Polyangiaceae bacterium]|nr:hypothetical protein [Polyangiaceae bacterium]